VNAAIHNLICVAALVISVIGPPAASSATKADRLNRPSYDYSSADKYLDLYAVALAPDRQPHALVSMKVPDATERIGELAVLRQSAGNSRMLEAVALDDSFALTTFMRFAVGSDDRSFYALAFSHVASDLRLRIHDRTGAKVSEALIEDDIKLPLRLLSDASGFILVTPHQLLRVDSDARIVHRFGLREGTFADALLLPVRDCPLLTLVKSREDDEHVSLERRCVDAEFTIHSVVDLAPGGSHRRPRLTAATRPLAALVSEPGGTERGTWTINTCSFTEWKPRCSARTISGVPFNPIQLQDGLQVLELAGGSLEVTALSTGAQKLWHGRYGADGEGPSTREEALPIVPGGYTIGHHALMTRTKGQVWTALAYMRVWGDRAPEGKRSHSAADMHISLYKEAAPR